MNIIEKIDEILKRWNIKQWKRTKGTVLGKHQRSVYLAFQAIPQIKSVSEIEIYVTAFEAGLIIMLEKVFDFDMTIKTLIKLNTLTLRVWLKNIREKDYHELGVGIDGYYIKMLQDASTLRELLDRTMSETDWIYAHDPNKKFSALDFKVEKLFKRGDSRFNENACYINVPTRKQLISLIVPSIFKNETKMYRSYEEWKRENGIIHTIHYFSPVASFLKFFMLKKYNLMWNQEYARWDAAHLEYEINEFLKLRLEWGETVIYVKGEFFHQCKYLLLNLDSQDLSQYDEIKSIDDAEEKLDNRNERDKSIIPSDVEFWGHCSNLQVWYENDYDTRLLHRNIAFPLLRELADAGDPLARKRFKEEIVLRLEEGSANVVRYLRSQGYLRYFKREEKEIVLMNALQEGKISLIQQLFQGRGFKNYKLEVNSFMLNTLSQKFEQFFLSTSTRWHAINFLDLLKLKGYEDIARILLEELVQTILEKGNRNHVNSFLNMIQYNFNGYISKEKMRELVIKLLERGDADNIRAVINRHYLDYLSRKDLESLQPKSPSFLYKHPFVRQFLIHRAHYSSIQLSKAYKIDALIKVDIRISPRKVYTLEFYESSFFLGLIYFNCEIHLLHVNAHDKENFKKISLHSNRVEYYITPKVNTQRMIPIIPVKVHRYILEILGESDVEIYYPKTHSYSSDNCVKYFNSRMKVGCEILPEYIIYPSLKEEKEHPSLKRRASSNKKQLIVDPEKYKKITDF